MFKKLHECFVNLLEIVIVLYVGNNDCHIQEKGKELLRKERFKHPVKQLQVWQILAYALRILI